MSFLVCVPILII